VSGTIREPEPDPRLKALLPDTRFHGDAKVERIESFRRAIEDAEPDAIINCIGVVKQDKETPAETMTLVNSEFPHRVAELAAEANAKLIHISTDCVFSGARGPYAEADAPDPVDLYGRSKLLGELDQPGTLTLRLSMIGHEIRHHRGLLDWLVAQRGGRVQGYANALFSGLTTIALTEILASVLRDHPKLEGLYHVSADPISKFALLQAVNRIYGLGIEIERDEAFWCDRRLDSSRFRQATGWRPSSWEEMIRTMYVASGAVHAGR
jgi:dTDP-4-dehydrorhamnose reductase